MAGRLALNRTVKLGQLIPEWGDEAYITVSPMLTADMAEFAKGRDNEENQDTEKLANEMLVWVTKKFVKGRVKIVQEDGTETFADATADDIQHLPFAVLADIFQVLVGKNFDPKATAKVATDENSQTSVAPSTETQS